MTKRKNQEPYTMPPEGFIRAAQVARVLSISESTLRQWIADGVVPKPIQLGPKASAWNVDVVRAWIADRSTSAT